MRIALVLFGFMPLLVMAARQVAGLQQLAAIGDTWFGFHCHREPARTLAVGGMAFPVCTRCLGIYLGLGLGALVVRPRLTAWPLRIWIVSAACLMLADVGSEYLLLRPDWALLRFVTGLLLAYPVGSSVVWAAREP